MGLHCHHACHCRQPLAGVLDETPAGRASASGVGKGRCGGELGQTGRHYLGVYDRDLLKTRRIVFNIKGNDFRLVAAVAYRYGAVYVKFVGTHRQYDRIEADTVEMS